jgi:hypothetical protein
MKQEYTKVAAGEVGEVRLTDIFLITNFYRDASKLLILTGYVQ